MLLELFGSVVGRFKRPRENTGEASRQGVKSAHEDWQYSGEHHGSTQADKTCHTRSKVEAPGFFAGAHHFVIKDSTMVEVFKTEIINNIYGGKTALERLSPYIIPGIAMDSGARHPPPRCHPGTRRRVGIKLETWLGDERRPRKMLWLHGPAGVGKSAVAQTFAEYCAENDRLGAALFFSRENKHNHPLRVFPTLAYQLAIQCKVYKNLLTHQLVDNPSILDAAMHVQFRKLIADPFGKLHAEGALGIQQPYLVILDGLDECPGEEAQCEIIEMIGEVIRRKDLPLIWLICSRPEPHIKYTFARTDFKIDCGREELCLDVESREDVDRYLRDGFRDIQARYTVDGSWPTKEQFTTISYAASGLFIFASTILKYVGDREYANPVARPDAVLSFTRASHRAGATNPLEMLDLLYTRILCEIANSILPITRRILSHHIYIPLLCGRTRQWPSSVQTLANFLSIDQNYFYRALGKLHSVVDVPDPEIAAETPLRFYHASFGDYLRDPGRSGRFSLAEESALADIAKFCLYWHHVDSTLYHTNDELDLTRVHEHAPLPNLRWVSSTNIHGISRDIAEFAESHCWKACTKIHGKSTQDLLHMFGNIDFRYIDYDFENLLNFANWLYEKVSAKAGVSVIRTVPAGPVDRLLLDYLAMMTDPEPVQPATFPLDIHNTNGSSWTREYFLLGPAAKTCIICLTKGKWDARLEKLNCDKPPSQERISQYRDWTLRTDSRWEEGSSEEGEEDSESGIN